MKIKQTILIFSISFLLPFCFFSNVAAQRKKPAKAKPIAIEEKSKIPVIEAIRFDKTEVYQSCPFAKKYRHLGCPVEEENVAISILSKNVEPDFEYYYVVSGGTIGGNGPSATWTLSGAQAGEYTITVAIGKNGIIYSLPETKSIKFVPCECCLFPCNCPTFSIKSPTTNPKHGDLIAISLSYLGSDVDRLEFKWTIVGGTIIFGQDTKTVFVKVSNDFSVSKLAVTADVSGNNLCDDCVNSASDSIEIIKK
jgi:hypothetical protein